MILNLNNKKKNQVAILFYHHYFPPPPYVSIVTELSLPAMSSLHHCYGKAINWSLSPVFCIILYLLALAQSSIIRKFRQSIQVIFPSPPPLIKVKDVEYDAQTKKGSSIYTPTYA